MLIHNTAHIAQKLKLTYFCNKITKEKKNNNKQADTINCIKCL